MSSFIILFLKCWETVKRFIGIEDGVSDRWKLIFERKIMEGDVGFSIKWPTRFHRDVLWDTEALIRDISDKDSVTTVAHELHRLIKTPSLSIVDLRHHSAGDADGSVEGQLENINVSRYVFDSEKDITDSCYERMISSPMSPSKSQTLIDKDTVRLIQTRSKQYVDIFKSKVTDEAHKSLCKPKQKLFHDDMQLLFSSTNNENRCQIATSLCYLNLYNEKVDTLHKLARRLSCLEMNLEELGSIDLQVALKTCELNTLPINNKEGILNGCDSFEITFNYFSEVNHSQNNRLSEYLRLKKDQLLVKTMRNPYPIPPQKNREVIESEVDPPRRKSKYDLYKDQAQKVEVSNVTSLRDERTRKVCFSPRLVVRLRQYLYSLLQVLRQYLFAFLQLLFCRRFKFWSFKNEGVIPRQRRPSPREEPVFTTNSARNPAFDTSPVSSPATLDDARDEMRFLQGKQALDYYKLLASKETHLKTRQMKLDREQVIERYTRKRKFLMELVAAAKDYYSDPSEARRRRWKTLKEALTGTHPSLTNVRMHVNSVRNRVPFFSVALMLCQTVVLAMMCTRFGVDRTGVNSYIRVREGIPTFLGSESFSAVEEPNPWFGPPERSFWWAGAAVARCQGGSKTISAANLASQHGRSLRGDRFGCCEMGSHFNRAGTTTFTECKKMTSDLGKWAGGVVCSQRIVPNNYVAHVIKPCCLPVTSECRMMSHEHCMFIRGVFHVGLDHCLQTNCPKIVCRINKNKVTAVLPGEREAVTDLHRLSWSSWLSWYRHSADSDSDTSKSRATEIASHKLPDTVFNSDTAMKANTAQNAYPAQVSDPHQWWRLLTALPFTFGALHLFLVVLVEARLMLPVERCTGWLRVMIIFLGGAVAGEMVACSVEPSRPHDGSTGGVAGFLGVAFLELFQAWPFHPHPWREAGKLVGLTLLFLAAGTFHLVSLASVLAGILLGVPLCLMVVPYITFGPRLHASRLTVVLIGIALFIPAAIFVHFGYVYTMASFTAESSAASSDIWLYRMIRKWECVRYMLEMCLTYQ